MLATKSYGWRFLSRSISSPRVRHRTFLSLSNDVQTYRIKRVVKVRPDVLYNVVADVKSYEHFIPYCQKSAITESDPSTNLPRRAVLQVGWNHINENFESVLKYDETTVIAEAFNNHMFKTLYTKWTVRPMASHPDKSLVNFELNFCFNSALYNSFSKNFGQSIASLMIKAFTDRASEIEKTR